LKNCHEKRIDKRCFDYGSFSYLVGAIFLSWPRFCGTAAEPETKSQTETLAKQTQNPVAKEAIRD
jgi:hypothetical protein